MYRGLWADPEAHREHCRQIGKQKRRKRRAGKWRPPDWDHCLTLSEAAAYLNISEEEFLRRQQTGFWAYQPVDPDVPAPRYPYKKLQDYRFHFLNGHHLRRRRKLERAWQHKAYAAKKQRLKPLATRAVVLQPGRGSE